MPCLKLELGHGLQGRRVPAGWQLPCSLVTPEKMLCAPLALMPLGHFVLSPCLEMTWKKATGNTRLVDRTQRPKHLQREPVLPKQETGLAQGSPQLPHDTGHRKARRMGNPRAVLSVSSQSGVEAVKCPSYALRALAAPAHPTAVHRPQSEAQLPPGRLKPPARILQCCTEEQAALPPNGMCWESSMHPPGNQQDLRAGGSASRRDAYPAPLPRQRPSGQAASGTVT